jgi:hypothetical protein
VTTALTEAQRAALVAVASGHFDRSAHQPGTLEVLERLGLIYSGSRKPAPTRKGLRTLVVPAEAAARKMGAIVGRALP